MNQKSPDIVFVYKAESGLVNKLKDAVHKTFSPSTYPCILCDVTYSPVHMRAQWRKFVEKLPYNVEFSYTDLIEKAHPEASFDYPCACLRQDGQLSLWLTADQINACDTIDELIALVTATLPDAQRIAESESDRE